MTTILHIARRAEWERAQAVGYYEAPSLARQGFIHCSLLGQVVRVANHLFKGSRDLVLLEIDPERLTAGVRFENLEAGEDLFPHVYGCIEIAAVRAVHDFQPDSKGAFCLPEELSAG